MLGHLRSNALRTAVTVFAVALGVAIALAIDLANTTAVASFASSVNVISNHVNLQVLGVGRGFADRTLRRVASVAGVSYAGPSIEDSIVIGAKPNDAFSGEVLRVLGIDLLQALPGDSSVSGGVPGRPSRAPGLPIPICSSTATAPSSASGLRAHTAGRAERWRPSSGCDPSKTTS